MAYTPNTWVARAGTGLNRFSYVMDGDYIYLTPAPESVQQTGTPFSTEWMNHIEQGIADAYENAPVDYVVETGTNGIWEYRKWESGYIECYCQQSIGEVSLTNTAQYLFYSNTLLLPLPNGLFTEIGHVELSAYNDGCLLYTSPASAGSEGFMGYSFIPRPSSANTAARFWNTFYTGSAAPRETIIWMTTSSGLWPASVTGWGAGRCCWPFPAGWIPRYAPPCSPKPSRARPPACLWTMALCA